MSVFAAVLGLTGALGMMAFAICDLIVAIVNGETCNFKEDYYER